MSTCHNNPEKLSTTKINVHTPSGYSMFTHCLFDLTKNKLDCYRGKDCMQRFYKDLEKHATKTINYEKKEMIPLTDKENESYKEQKVCYICKKNLVLLITIKSIIKKEIIVITQENVEELLMIFVIYDTKHQKKFL